MKWMGMVVRNEGGSVKEVMYKGMVWEKDGERMVEEIEEGRDEMN